MAFQNMRQLSLFFLLLIQDQDQEQTVDNIKEGKSGKD